MPTPGGRWLLYRTRHSNSPDEFDIGVSDLKTGARHMLTKGVIARRIAPGLLAIVRADGALSLARVDDRTMTLEGHARTGRSTAFAPSCWPRSTSPSARAP